MGVRLGAFAPSMRRTGQVGFKRGMTQGGKLNMLLTAPSARYLVDLFRYAPRCERAMKVGVRVPSHTLGLTNYD